MENAVDRDYQPDGRVDVSVGTLRWAPHLEKMATWADRAPTMEAAAPPIGIVCEPWREQMRTKATLSLAIGLCVACVAILIALHLLEPEFNPPHLVSEYQLGRFGWLMSLVFFCLGAASFALFVGKRFIQNPDALGPGGCLSSASPISVRAFSLLIQSGPLAACCTASEDWSSSSVRPWYSRW